MASVDLLSIKTTEQDKKAQQVKEKIAQHASDRGLLVVKVNSTGEGVLTERQKKWLNTTSYDKTTENPVVYKLAIESLKPSKEAIEREEARHEVQSLFVRPPSTQQTSSGVAQRITENRRERHEQTIKDMKEELSRIKDELESKIQKASESLKSQLATNDKVIESLFARVGSAKLLESYTLEQLYQLWSEVSSQSPLRQQHIRELDSTLSAVEDERHQMVTEVLKSYAHMLQTIAFLLPDDVQRLIDEEALNINVAMLANKKTYTQLCIHLMTTDFAREKEHRRKWEAIVLEWKDLICKLTKEEFISFMESDEIQRPVEMESLKELLAAEQAGLQRRRMELLQQMAEMRPPRATKTTVYEWGESAEKLNQQLETVHCKYLLKFQSCQETVNSVCESKMENCRKYLVSSGAFDADNVYRVMTRQFLPLVEQQNVKSKEQLQAIEKSLDLIMSSQKEQFHSIFQYAQGAAHLWDTHSVTMDQLERNFQEGLDKCRSKHDTENQNLEANLDVVLDRLRQGASQEMLTQYLSEALKMLDTIKFGYTTFHTTMMEEIEKYPTLVQHEMESYDIALCKYLGVGRSLPKKRSKSQLTKTSSEILKSESRSSSRKSLKGNRAKTMASMQRQDTTGSSKGGVADGLTGIVAEVISTRRGTNFYLNTISHSSLSDGPGTFLTQDEESEGSVQSFATETIAISDETFSKIRNGLCASFLEHMEQTKSDAMKQAKESVEAKKEEARTELDLRLHLHQPRHSRVEQDIHNVRAAELVAHRDRVARHAQSVVASLNHQKALVQTLADKHKPEADRFTEEVASLESSLGQMKTTTELLKLQAHSKELLHQHLSQLDLLSSEHLSASEDNLQQLANSNDSFKVSLRLFSEGGNYCPEEVELFSKKMTKMSSKITSAQTFISNEVASITETQKTSGNEIYRDFEAKFSTHFADLSFLEVISRTLTSAQVKIKSEVAASNTQARELFEQINKMKKMMQEVQNKSLPPSALLSELPSLFQAFKSRTDYLYCHAHKRRGTRVGGHPDTPLTPSHSNAKIQGPISAVNITKSIMSHSRSGAAIGPIDTYTDLKASPSHEELHRKRGDGKQSRRKTITMERKNLNFGIGGGEDGSSCFLPKIRAILKAVHAQLYKITEAYYKSKGSRPPTCPEEIHESFELFMDSLIEKSQRYRDQAEEYRNNCIEEFRSQLDTVMSLMVEIPGLVFSSMCEQHGDETNRDREGRVEGHSTVIIEMEKSRLSHESSLRPALGHPSQSEELAALCDKEEQRHNKTLKTIQENAQSVRESECQYLVQFVKVLVETTNSLLSLFDTSINSSEIVPGSGAQHARLPMEHLLREHMGQQTTPKTTAEEDSLQEVTTHKGRHVWPGLPAEEMKLVWELLPPPPTTETKRKSVMNSSKSKRPSSRMSVVASPSVAEGGGEGQDKLKELSALAGVLMEKVTSKKHTAAHSAVVSKRDEVFKEYILGHQRAMEEIKKKEGEDSHSEEKWFTNWTSSVERIRQLYS